MSPTLARRRFLDDHRDLPPRHVIGLIGSHRRVQWPSLCPACGAPASTHLDVAKVFGRRARYSGRAYYRSLVRLRIPYCPSCAARHHQLVAPVPSVLGSFVRTPALLSFIGAVAVAGMLSMIFLQGGEGLSPGARLYALGGIVALVALGTVITASEACYLHVPPLTEITRACDFSANLGFPLGRRRLYAIRHPAFAEAFTRVNHDRLWTDAIRTRDAWISGIAFAVLIVAALIAWVVRG
jgi:hypothetical protein